MKKSTFREKLRHIIKDRHLLILLLPCLLYTVIFKYIPMAGIVIAFQDYKVSRGVAKSEWVGFTNFHAFFNSSDFVELLRNTLIIGIYSILIFPVPIFFALLLNELRSKAFMRSVQTISYLPFFLSTVVVVGIAYNMLSPNGGLVNQVLNAFGVDSIYFIAESRYFRSIYIGLGLWQYLGYNSIVYAAAISGVPQEQYDSAEIDGCNRLMKVIHITIPSISITVAVMFIVCVGGMISLSFERVLLLQTPATYDVSDVISTFVYRKGLRNMNLSYATAVDLFNSVISVFLLVTANAFSRKVADTSIW